MKPPVSQRLLTKTGARAAVRRAALAGLSSSQRGETRRRLSLPRLQNLYLHFLPEKQEGQFVSFIRRLKQGHEFISYSEMVKRSRSGPIDRPYLTISFDDGFFSNLRAARILASEGVSACFFVCPDLLGMSREELLSVFPNSLDSEVRSLTWDEVEEVLSLGHEIGSHTLSHPVLTDLRIDQAQHQIHSSKDALEKRFGRINHFAWPRGQFHHFSPDLLQEVVLAGYESCSSAVRGAHIEPSLQHMPCVYREHWVCDWPSEHMLYLMGRSVQKSLGNKGSWPEGWTTI